VCGAAVHHESRPIRVIDRPWLRLADPRVYARREREGVEAQAQHRIVGVGQPGQRAKQTPAEADGQRLYQDNDDKGNVAQEAIAQHAIAQHAIAHEAIAYEDSRDIERYEDGRVCGTRFSGHVWRRVKCIAELGDVVTEADKLWAASGGVRT
jgi:hypothetical protein